MLATNSVGSKLVILAGNENGGPDYLYLNELEVNS